MVSGQDRNVGNIDDQKIQGEPILNTTSFALTGLENNLDRLLFGSYVVVHITNGRDLRRHTGVKISHMET